ncbi:MerR family transcriptional regulator [Sulfitobacter noctilucicola]|uniref:Chaperone modulatory protein CbpM n=1 Tax=Sulfitobacter noctilucicola TaxID=1342301 RepID=A0A7W6Q2Q6_9RHOB|nr:chaperone modulator CbpM [Sulfitobacter noctilucicola]KIN62674.1 MerR family transcriptional regulator [Sulfitobacter noctilucicola]MBB4172793.1 chaperone modulatory protein CbpM [Sulfitobacter noctilucicola]
MKRTTVHSDLVEALSLQDLCRFCHADEDWVIELVEHGVIEPVGSNSGNWRFVGTSILRAKKARRLSRDLGVNTAGVALVLDLIEERDSMLRRLAQYEAS